MRDSVGIWVYAPLVASMIACGGSVSAPPPKAPISEPVPHDGVAAPAPPPIALPTEPAPVAPESSARKGPSEVDAALQPVSGAIAAKDFAAAQKGIDAARALTGGDAEERFKVDYKQATLHAYRGDLEAAAAVFVTFLEEIPERLDSPLAFRVHNILMMLRGGQGDLLAALAENDACTRIGLRGTWERGEPPRAVVVAMKDAWHRAYLYRMWAERAAGSRRRAALRYAEEARKAYADLVKERPDYGDSIAVLDGLFAALDGDKARALAAGRRIDVANNDDVEDLYLAAVALEAGGDVAAAEAVKKRIRGAPPYLAVPILVKFLDADAGKGKARFSPRRPTGAP